MNKRFKMSNPNIEVYTDGSCHTQQCIGGWAAILFIGEEKITLNGKATDTTHNQMELMAVIKAIEYVRKNYPAITELQIVSDSQYVIGLTGRKQKLSAQNFSTKKGNEIRNIDLVKTFLNLTEIINITFIKIKAHQKKTDVINHNIEVDKLSRKIVRDAVKELDHVC